VKERLRVETLSEERHKPELNLTTFSSGTVGSGINVSVDQNDGNILMHSLASEGSGWTVDGGDVQRRTGLKHLTRSTECGEG